MIFFLSLIAADPATMMRNAAARVPTCAQGRCGEPARRSRYRLAPTPAGPADGKADAVAVTGETCAITGPTLCTHRPHTWLAASY